MKKSTYIIIAIVIILMIIGICVFAFVGNKENKNTASVNTNAISNNMENIEQNEQINEIIQNVVENKTTNEVVENKIENTVSSETFEESPKTAEEKAINIVKKDWGSSNSVDVSVDGMNEKGDYIVAVRDANTTEALAFYTVNVSSGTFNKKEMN